MEEILGDIIADDQVKDCMARRTCLRFLPCVPWLVSSSNAPPRSSSRAKAASSSCVIGDGQGLTSLPRPRKWSLIRSFEPQKVVLHLMQQYRADVPLRSITMRPDTPSTSFRGESTHTACPSGIFDLLHPGLLSFASGPGGLPLRHIHALGRYRARAGNTTMGNSAAAPQQMRERGVPTLPGKGFLVVAALSCSLLVFRSLLLLQGAGPMEDLRWWASESAGYTHFRLAHHGQNSTPEPPCSADTIIAVVESFLAIGTDGCGAPSSRVGVPAIGSGRDQRCSASFHFELTAQPANVQCADFISFTIS